jgi:hypothetical protein
VYARLGRVAGGQKCWPITIADGMPAVAAGVYETGFGFFRRAVLAHGGLDDRLACGGQPPLPLAWGWWRVFVEQVHVHVREDFHLFAAS